MHETLNPVPTFVIVSLTPAHSKVHVPIEVVASITVTFTKTDVADWFVAFPGVGSTKVILGGVVSTLTVLEPVNPMLFAESFP